MSEISFSTNSILALTKELICIPSTKSNPVSLHQVLDIAKKYLKNVPDLVIKQIIQNNIPSLIIQTVDTLTPDILLLGHLDVVPGEDAQFVPTEKDGRLFGRGACDMKSGVAVLIELFKHFSQITPKPNLTLILTTDEESGGSNGVQYLVDTLGYRAKVAIIPDGGLAPNELIIENKGLYHFLISAKGKTAHASRPWEGENAACNIIDAINRVRQMFKPEISDIWNNTCVVSKLEAGKAINQVPDSATAALDIRFTHETDQQKLLKQIKQAAAPCDVTVLVEASSSKIPKDNKYIVLYSTILKDTLGLETNFIQTPGGNDGRFLTKHDIPIIVSRPLSNGLHGPVEWVDVKGLEEYALFYKSFLESLLITLNNE